MIEFEQAGIRYHMMSEEEQTSLVTNIAESMMFLEKETQKDVLDYFFKVSDELGKKIEKRLRF